jgi:iron complex transport system ATP-binding protein
VIGPNGAGKSTLLKLLAGVRTPDSGSVKLGESDWSAVSVQQRAQTVAYLEQRPHLQWPLTVQQVVALGLLPHGQLTLQNRNQTRGLAAVESALAYTGIETLRARQFHTLSEGEKMLVNLSRVLATQPKIILADEPTAALDPYHQLQVLELLRKLADLGMGLILVLHDLNLAARFCDRLLLLHEGKVVSTGSPEEVLHASNLAATYHIDAEYQHETRMVINHGRLDS